MKKILLFAVLIWTVSATHVQARGIRIPIGEHQKISQVMELPDSAYYQTDMGGYINLGYMYTVYEIAYIPVWTTDKGMLVGYSPEEPDTFYELDDDLRTWITEDTGVEDLEALKTMPFWDAWGGKLAAVVVLIGIVFYFRSKTGGEEETQPTASTAEKPEQEA